jgi:hypothetical protein
MNECFIYLPIMKRIAFLFFLYTILLVSCKNKTGPDVSDIKVDIQTVRFEKEFFSIDTLNAETSLLKIFNEHPDFFRDFTQHILGLPPATDSGAQAIRAVKQFLHDYRPVYDSVMKAFPDFNREQEEISNSLRYVKYYFPKYQLPQKIITFIGPMDAYFQGSTAGYGDAITTEGLAIGLQLHLGSDFSMYNSEMGLSLFPSYISRKFSREYIPVNSIKNIIDDMFPDESADKTLVEQMIEKGKRIYLTKKFMPDTHDTLILGYTSPQLEGCKKNERLIWQYFVKNGLVFNNDPSLIKNYVGDSPNTPEFGEGAPGNISLFVGWQIVKQFIEKNEALSLTELMAMEPRKIFEESKYRPE